MRKVTEWIGLVKDTTSAFHDKLTEICGDDDVAKAEAAQMCLQTLESFADRYGPDNSVIIARSTGRVNLVGTHIDHRGGSVNPIAVKQMWLVAEPRSDDLVLVKNVESEHGSPHEIRSAHLGAGGGGVRYSDSGMGGTAQHRYAHIRYGGPSVCKLLGGRRSRDHV